MEDKGWIERVDEPGPFPTHPGGSQQKLAYPTIAAGQETFQERPLGEVVSNGDPGDLRDLSAD